MAEGPENPKAVAGDNSIAASQAALRSYIERIERLDEECRALRVDIREIFAEAKGKGFNVKVIRRVLAERKLDPQKLEEFRELVEFYTSILR